MRRANNTGSIYKLGGKRYKPYGAYITTNDKVFDEENKKAYKKRVCIGSYATKKEAQQALDEYFQNPYDVDASAITFGEIWRKEYAKMSLSESRMQQLRLSYKNYCMPLDTIPIRQIKQRQLQEIVDSCPYSSSAKSVIKSIMNRCFDYAVSNDIVQKDYSKYVKFKQDDVQVERVLFTGDEVATLMDHYKDWFCAYILILLYTGLRPTELCNLEKKDVHETYFDVLASKTKAGVRSVPICDALKPVFDYYMSIDGKYLLQSSKGNKIEYRNYMARDLIKVTEILGARHTPYECRHTFITRCRECKVDHLCLQRIVGHKPDTITEEIYTHLKMQELIEEINKLNY